MIVGNRRNGKQTSCLIASSILQQMRGLMFRRRPVSILFDFGKGGAHPIHSFFVFFPFYAIYISEGKKVLEKFRVEPFMPLCRNSLPARYLLETDIKTGEYFSVGDEVDFDARMENH